jgi:hypothetical protein
MPSAVASTVSRGPAIRLTWCGHGLRDDGARIDPDAFDPERRQHVVQRRGIEPDPPLNRPQGQLE